MQRARILLFGLTLLSWGCDTQLDTTLDAVGDVSAVAEVGGVLPDSGPDSGPQPVADTPADTSFVPTVELVLTIQDAFDGGLVATVEGAVPGAPVVLYTSVDPDAEPSCPKVLAPECLAFGGETVLGDGVADGEGVAILKHAALAAGPETTIRFQAGSWAYGRGFVSAVVSQQGVPEVPPDTTLDTDKDGLSDLDEADAKTDPEDPDSDDDGLSDGDEVHVHGTNPLSPDSDGDGLLDGVEVNSNTDAMDADTDHDGLSDGDEAKYGTDPTNPDSDSDKIGDGAEVHVYGSDPLDEDSDGDGIDDGAELLVSGSPTGLEPAGPDGPTSYDPFGDCDGDGVMNAFDAEICNGVDDDCDGLVDEGYNTGDDDGDGVLDCLENEDCDCIDDDGDGLIAEHCEYGVTITTAGPWKVGPSVDATSLGTLISQGAPTVYQHSQWGTVDPLMHVTFIPQRYNAYNIGTASEVGDGAMKASVRVNGTLVGVSGVGPGWYGFAAGVANWWDTAPGSPPHLIPASCYNGYNTPGLDADGAQSIWGGPLNPTCAKEAWGHVRFDVNLCGSNIEVCDGIDNDGDSLIDEGTPDADGDGICNVFDHEECDGIDNNGNGVIDEGTPDIDGDGLCNEQDSEECDGIDNNGNGQIDEGPDLNGDGISDCAQDLCTLTTPSPMFTCLGTGEIRVVDPQNGVFQSLGFVVPALSDLTVSPEKAVYGVVPIGAQMHLYQVGWTQPASLQHIKQLGTVVNLATGNNGAVTVGDPGFLIVGWDNTLYSYELATEVLTPLVTGPNLIQIRGLTWRQGELFAAGWRDGYGPAVYRWSRLNNTLVEVLGYSDLLLNASNGAQMRPVSIATDPTGASYLNMEFSFQYYNGIESNSVYAYDIPSASINRLWRYGGYPNGVYLKGATFPGTWCQRAIEVCDGTDNDGDGLIDEGFDANQDGTPDCYVDVCNDIDDDGDGLVDEDGVDNDGDGICNELDIEHCDGIDNDGDGVIDDVDLDADGIVDCGADPCSDLSDLHFVSSSVSPAFAATIRRFDKATNSFGASFSTTRLTDFAITPELMVLGLGTYGGHGYVMQLDVKTGRAQRLVQLPGGGTSTDMGIAADAMGRIWVAFGHWLYTLDLTTGTWTAKEYLPWVGNDLTFHDGRVWVLSTMAHYYDELADQLVPVGGYLGGGARVFDVTPGGDMILGIINGSVSNMQLKDFDPITGGSTSFLALPSNIDPLGMGGLGSLCQSMVEICDGLDNDQDGFIDEDSPDTDNDGVADCLDVEECDCLDNNGDGQIDEICLYSVTVHMLADDQGSAYLDGGLIGVAAGWTLPTSSSVTTAAGSHRIGLHASSSTAPAAGLRAVVMVNGQPVARTGDPGVKWVPPVLGWPLLTSNTTGALVPNPPWSASPLFDAVGADWIWADNGNGPVWDGVAAWTVDIDICGAYDFGLVEYCDGLDNDADGLVDEGFPDLDQDGTADCITGETKCDGIDNDGDGQIDEGFGDSDLDGIADCADTEECDLLDNDGDGLVDEGFQVDTDGDGIIDCFDVETCDGLDNDGDGLIDEGFPDSNNDSIADCIAEPCDCLDNDGDGAIDEDCTYTVSFALTGMGTWKSYMDGVLTGSDGDWTTVETVSTTVSGGDHLLAVFVALDGSSTGGFIAKAWVNGAPLAETGDGQWRVGMSPLPVGWQTNPAGWVTAQVVTTMVYPGPAWLMNQGAQWVWSPAPNAGVPENGYVLPFTVCGEPTWAAVEVCDSVDNTGDGKVDAGFEDADDNGTADCADEAAFCDPKAPATDLDGDELPDCESAGGVESDCNCVDDDGDGQIDEGCVFEVEVKAESFGLGQMWLNGSPVAEGLGDWGKTLQVEHADLDPEKLTALLAFRVEAGPDLAGFHAEVTVNGAPNTTTSPKSWAASESEMEGWNKLGLSKPAVYGGCDYTNGSPEAAQYLWSGACEGDKAAPVNYFTHVLSVCPN